MVRRFITLVGITVAGAAGKPYLSGRPRKVDARQRSDQAGASPWPEGVPGPHTMLLWITLAAMTAATLAAVLQPLRRRTDAAAGETAASVAVYKDQLAEIDSDLERGLIDASEAKAARVEVQRRLLNQGETDRTNPARLPPSQGAMWAIIVLVPAVAIAAYTALGSPHLPGQPLSVRRAASPEAAQVEMLVARVEEQLRRTPDDGRGWEVLAPVYARLGRTQDALDAWRHAIRLQGATRQRLRGLVEASLAVTRGIVDAEAQTALESLRRGDPDDPIPRFWLAIAMQQNGQRAEAAAEFKALLDSAPADAPWRPAVQERLADLTGKPVNPRTGETGQATATAQERGPTAEQITAAGQMSAEDRSRMVAGMVEGLAARLERDGQDPDGWLRLINAYSVLGRHAEAKAAVAKARQALAADSQALARIAEKAKELGL